MIQREKQSKNVLRTLKKHCNTDYVIKSETHKVGNMTDAQLEISHRILRNKRVLTPVEKDTLRSIKYVENYRSERHQDRLFGDSILRRKVRAVKSAELITNWITKSYKD
jgi:hypothetical protein